MFKGASVDFYDWNFKPPLQEIVEAKLVVSKSSLHMSTGAGAAAFMSTGAGAATSEDALVDVGVRGASLISGS